MADDRLNVQPHDPEALAEIEMTSNLIIAASESAGPLDQRQIDAVLGVAPAPATAGALQDREVD